MEMPNTRGQAHQRMVDFHQPGCARDAEHNARKEGEMIDKRSYFKREIEKIDRELRTPVDSERRRRLEAARKEVQLQKAKWERPH